MTEWEPGEMLFTIEKVVCKDCLVGFMCDTACLNYQTVRGSMMAWIQGCNYNISEEEFKMRLGDAMELIE